MSDSGTESSPGRQRRSTERSRENIREYVKQLLGRKGSESPGRRSPLPSKEGKSLESTPQKFNQDTREDYFSPSQSILLKLSPDSPQVLKSPSKSPLERSKSPLDQEFIDSREKIKRRLDTSINLKSESPVEIKEGEKEQIQSPKSPTEQIQSPKLPSENSDSSSEQEMGKLDKNVKSRKGPSPGGNSRSNSKDHEKSSIEKKKESVKNTSKRTASPKVGKSETKADSKGSSDSVPFLKEGRSRSQNSESPTLDLENVGTRRRKATEEKVDSLTPPVVRNKTKKQEGRELRKVKGKSLETAESLKKLVQEYPLRESTRSPSVGRGTPDREAKSAQKSTGKSTPESSQSNSQSSTGKSTSESSSQPSSNESQIKKLRGRLRLNRNNLETSKGAKEKVPILKEKDRVPVLKDTKVPVLQEKDPISKDTEGPSAISEPVITRMSTRAGSSSPSVVLSDSDSDVEKISSLRKKKQMARKNTPSPKLTSVRAKYLKKSEREREEKEREEKKKEEREREEKEKGEEEKQVDRELSENEESEDDLDEAPLISWMARKSKFASVTSDKKVSKSEMKYSKKEKSKATDSVKSTAITDKSKSVSSDDKNLVDSSNKKSVSIDKKVDRSNKYFSSDDKNMTDTMSKTSFSDDKKVTDSVSDVKKSSSDTTKRTSTCKEPDSAFKSMPVPSDKSKVTDCANKLKSTSDDKSRPKATDTGNASKSPPNEIKSKVTDSVKNDSSVKTKSIPSDKTNKVMDSLSKSASSEVTDIVDHISKSKSVSSDERNKETDIISKLKSSTGINDKNEKIDSVIKSNSSDDKNTKNELTDTNKSPNKKIDCENKDIDTIKGKSSNEKSKLSTSLGLKTERTRRSLKGTNSEETQGHTNDTSERELKETKDIVKETSPAKTKEVEKSKNKETGTSSIENKKETGTKSSLQSDYKKSVGNKNETPGKLAVSEIEGDNKTGDMVDKTAFKRDSGDSTAKIGDSKTGDKEDTNSYSEVERDITKTGDRQTETWRDSKENGDDETEDSASSDNNTGSSSDFETGDSDSGTDDSDLETGDSASEKGDSETGENYKVTPSKSNPAVSPIKQVANMLGDSSRKIKTKDAGSSLSTPTKNPATSLSTTTKNPATSLSTTTKNQAASLSTTTKNQAASLSTTTKNSTATGSLTTPTKNSGPSLSVPTKYSGASLSTPTKSSGANLSVSTKNSGASLSTPAKNSGASLSTPTKNSSGSLTTPTKINQKGVSSDHTIPSDSAQKLNASKKLSKVKESTKNPTSTELTMKKPSKNSPSSTESPIKKPSTSLKEAFANNDLPVVQKSSVQKGIGVFEFTDISEEVVVGEETAGENDQAGNLNSIDKASTSSTKWDISAQEESGSSSEEEEESGKGSSDPCPIPKKDMMSPEGRVALDHSYSSGSPDKGSTKKKSPVVYEKTMSPRPVYSSNSIAKRSLDIMLHNDKINILRQMSQIFNDEKPPQTDTDENALSSSDGEEKEDKEITEGRETIKNGKEIAKNKASKITEEREISKNKASKITEESEISKEGKEMVKNKARITEEREISKNKASKKSKGAEDEIQVASSAKTPEKRIEENEEEEVTSTDETVKQNSMQTSVDLPTEDAPPESDIGPPSPRTPKPNEPEESSTNAEANADSNPESEIDITMDQDNVELDKSLSEISIGKPVPGSPFLGFPDTDPKEHHVPIYTTLGNSEAKLHHFPIYTTLGNDPKVHHVPIYSALGNEKILIKSSIGPSGETVDIIDGFTFVSFHNKHEMEEYDNKIGGGVMRRRRRRKKRFHFKKRHTVKGREMEESTIQDINTVADDVKENSNSAAFASNDLDAYLDNNSRLNISYQIPKCQATEDGVTKLNEREMMGDVTITPVPPPSVSEHLPVPVPVHMYPDHSELSSNTESQGTEGQSMVHQYEEVNAVDILYPKEKYKYYYNKELCKETKGDASSVFVRRAGKLVPLTSVLKSGANTNPSNKKFVELVYIYDGGQLLTLGGSLTKINPSNSDSVRARVVLPKGVPPIMKGEAVGYSSIEAVEINEDMAKFALTALWDPNPASKEPKIEKTKTESIQSTPAKPTPNSMYTKADIKMEVKKEEDVKVKKDVKILKKEVPKPLLKPTKTNILDIIAAKLAMSDEDSDGKEGDDSKKMEEKSAKKTKEAETDKKTEMTNIDSKKTEGETDKETEDMDTDAPKTEEIEDKKIVEEISANKNPEDEKKSEKGIADKNKGEKTDNKTNERSVNVDNDKTNDESSDNEDDEGTKDSSDDEKTDSAPEKTKDDNSEDEKTDSADEVSSDIKKSEKIKSLNLTLDPKCTITIPQITGTSKSKKSAESEENKDTTQETREGDMESEMSKDEKDNENEKGTDGKKESKKEESEESKTEEDTGSLVKKGISNLEENGERKEKSSTGKDTEELSELKECKKILEKDLTSENIDKTDSSAIKEVKNSENGDEKDGSVPKVYTSTRKDMAEKLKNISEQGTVGSSTKESDPGESLKTDGDPKQDPTGTPNSIDALSDTKSNSSSCQDLGEETEDSETPKAIKINLKSRLFKRNIHRFPSLSREMKRLNMNFVKYVPPQEPQKEEEVKPAEPIGECNNEHCKLGCVCESLSCLKRSVEHCGRVECMFECSCRDQSWKHSMNTSGKSMNAVSIFNLDREQNEGLALREKDFKRTVIQTGSEVILVGAERRKRERKIPGRYRDSSIWPGNDYDQFETSKICAPPSELQEQELEPISIPLSEASRYIKNFKLNIPWYDIKGISIWCMDHSCYDCYCLSDPYFNESDSYSTLDFCETESSVSEKIGERIRERTERNIENPVRISEKIGERRISEKIERNIEDPVPVKSEFEHLEEHDFKACCTVVNIIVSNPEAKRNYSWKLKEWSHFAPNHCARTAGYTRENISYENKNMTISGLSAKSTSPQEIVESVVKSVRNKHEKLLMTSMGHAPYGREIPSDYTQSGITSEHNQSKHRIDENVPFVDLTNNTVEENTAIPMKQMGPESVGLKRRRSDASSPPLKKIALYDEAKSVPHGQKNENVRPVSVPASENPIEAPKGKKKSLSLLDMMLAEEKRGELELDLSDCTPGNALLVAEARFRKLINMNIIGVIGINKAGRCIIGTVDSIDALRQMQRIHNMIINNTLDVGPNMREIFFPPPYTGTRPRFVMIRCDLNRKWEIVGVVQKKDPSRPRHPEVKRAPKSSAPQVIDLEEDERPPESTSPIDKDGGWEGNLPMIASVHSASDSNLEEIMGLTNNLEDEGTAQPSEIPDAEISTQLSEISAEKSEEPKELQSEIPAKTEGPAGLKPPENSTEKTEGSSEIHTENTEEPKTDDVPKGLKIKTAQELGSELPQSPPVEPSAVMKGIPDLVPISSGFTPEKKNSEPTDTQAQPKQLFFVPTGFNVKGSATATTSDSIPTTVPPVKTVKLNMASGMVFGSGVPGSSSEPLASGSGLGKLSLLLPKDAAMSDVVPSTTGNFQAPVASGSGLGKISLLLPKDAAKSDVAPSGTGNFQPPVMPILQPGEPGKMIIPPANMSKVLLMPNMGTGTPPRMMLVPALPGATPSDTGKGGKMKMVLMPSPQENSKMILIPAPTDPSTSQNMSESDKKKIMVLPSSVIGNLISRSAPIDSTKSGTISLGDLPNIPTSQTSCKGTLFVPINSATPLPIRPERRDSTNEKSVDEETNDDVVVIGTASNKLTITRMRPQTSAPGTIPAETNVVTTMQTISSTMPISSLPSGLQIPGQINTQVPADAATPVINPATSLPQIPPIVNPGGITSVPMKQLNPHLTTAQLNSLISQTHGDMINVTSSVLGSIPSVPSGQSGSPMSQVSQPSQASQPIQASEDNEKNSIEVVEDTRPKASPIKKTGYHWSAVDLSLSFKSVKLEWLLGTIRKNVLVNIYKMSMKTHSPVTLSVKNGTSSSMLYGMARINENDESMVPILILGSLVSAVMSSASTPDQRLFLFNTIKYFIRENTGELSSYTYDTSGAYLVKIASKKRGDGGEMVGIGEKVPVEKLREEGYRHIKYPIPENVESEGATGSPKVVMGLAGAIGVPTGATGVTGDPMGGATGATQDVSRCSCSASGDFMCMGHSAQETVSKHPALSAALSSQSSLLHKPDNKEQNPLPPIALRRFSASDNQGWSPELRPQDFLNPLPKENSDPLSDVKIVNVKGNQPMNSSFLADARSEDGSGDDEADDVDIMGDNDSNFILNNLRQQMETNSGALARKKVASSFSTPAEVAKRLLETQGVNTNLGIKRRFDEIRTPTDKPCPRSRKVPRVNNQPFKLSRTILLENETDPSMVMPSHLSHLREDDYVHAAAGPSGSGTGTLTCIRKQQVPSKNKPRIGTTRPRKKEKFIDVEGFTEERNTEVHNELERMRRKVMRHLFFHLQKCLSRIPNNQLYLESHSQPKNLILNVATKVCETLREEEMMLWEEEEKIRQERSSMIKNLASKIADGPEETRVKWRHWVRDNMQNPTAKQTFEKRWTPFNLERDILMYRSDLMDSNLDTDMDDGSPLPGPASPIVVDKARYQPQPPPPPIQPPKPVIKIKPIPKPPKPEPSTSKFSRVPEAHKFKTKEHQTRQIKKPKRASRRYGIQSDIISSYQDPITLPDSAIMPTSILLMAGTSSRGRKIVRKEDINFVSK